MRIKAQKETFFQKDWLDDPLFIPWLKQKEEKGVINDRCAYCKICNKTLKLGNMGRRAITSHMNGANHQNRANPVSSTIQKFFPKTPESESKSKTSEDNPAPPLVPLDASNSGSSFCKCNCKCKSASSLQGFVKTESVTKAEVLWCLNAVKHHRSINSAAKETSIFSVMFPDSDIAAKMELERTKMYYNIVFGLAPYCQTLLEDKLKHVEFYTVGFDESFNKISNKGQMDLSIRYYDELENKTQVSYFSSAFLGHATAKNLLTAFLEVTKPLDLSKLLNVSMDGPNVNLKFLRELKMHLKNEFDSPEILDLGTCGLHSMNNGFKACIEATGWPIKSYLTSLFYLFRQTPARRADYTHITGSSLFAEKYCLVRWLENHDVAERGIKMLPHVEKYIETVEKKGSEIAPPKTKSYTRVKSACKNKLLLPRLRFFQQICKELQPFLTYFQSDNPLAPFLYRKLLAVLKSIFTCFLTPTFMESKGISEITIKDLRVESNLLPAKKIVLGFAVKDAIRKAGPFSQDDLTKFREDCRSAYVALCNKILERSPLKFRLTEAISFLDPRVAEKGTDFKSRSDACLDIMVERAWLSGSQADKICKQLNSVKEDDVSFIKLMKSYSTKTCRLDVFWINTVLQKDTDTYGDLIKLIKMICTLSHGNAWLERGFSANKEMLVVNMKERSLLAQRLIFDHIKDKDLKTYVIDSKCLKFIKSSRSMYEKALKAQQTEIQNEKESKQRKRILMGEINELQAKKRKTTEDFCNETSGIDRSLREKQHQLESV